MPEAETIKPSRTDKALKSISSVDLQICDLPAQAIDIILGDDRAQGLHHRFQSLVEIITERKNHSSALIFTDGIEEDLLGMGLEPPKAKESVRKLVRMVEMTAGELRPSI